MGVIFQNGFITKSNGFILYGNEFNSYWNGNGINSSNTNGFTNMYGYQNLSDCTYVLHDAITNIITRASNVATNAGMNPSYAYVWNVTWADSSTGLCRVGINNQSNGELILAPIDPTDTRWQSGDINSKSLAGTFNFPATFTPYIPLTGIGGATQWC